MKKQNYSAKFSHLRSGLVTSMALVVFTTSSCAMDSSYAPVSITKYFSEVMKEDINNKSSLMNKGGFDS
jgi:hypothetical protein